MRSYPSFLPHFIVSLQEAIERILRMKKFFLLLLNTINICFQIAVAIVLVLMALLMFVEVIRRYIWNLQFAWSEELIRYMALWIAFLGGAVAYHNKALVCFDLLSNKIVGRKKLILELASNTVILAFLLLIFFLGIKNVMSPSTNRQISVGQKVSKAYPYASIPDGTGMMTIFSINNYFEIIGRYRNYCAEKGKV